MAYLPAADIADRVNDVLNSGNALVVTAPPGAGKSTLLPLTIMAGDIVEGKIVMLEPRRLAARQVAERMANILAEPVGQTVGYRVRFESRVSKDTRIEVVTEGVLTRMLVADPTLDGVGMVIFDEYHERSLASDLDMALVRRAQQIIRDDLKVVVMSATIDAAAIGDMLAAPIIESKGRMFPVEIRYASDDAVKNIASGERLAMEQEVARTIVVAHREHKGDILVFLPGQGEIQRVAEMLGESLLPTQVIPLYANLSPEMQRRAIAPSREGERKVVLATPVAETSLTIEGVRIVVDSGLCRKPVFNVRNGLSSLETVGISKDMMTQRTGRAGRVAEGVCYRLWQKVAEHQFADQRRPEIEDADLAPVMLSVAAFGENDIMALPWITPPPQANAARARQLLEWLGAINTKGGLTAIGKAMAEMPCHPRIARMILECQSADMKALACDIAALLDEKDPLAAEQSADIMLRLDALRTARRRKNIGRWNRVAMVAKEYQRMAGIGEDNSTANPMDAGRLIAYAYPERVAKAVDAVGGYRMASGDNVRVDAADDMAAHEWIAVASVAAGAGRMGRVALAAPVEPDRLPAEEFDNVAWNSKKGCMVMRREWRIGKLVVDSKPLQMADKTVVADIICEAMKKDGLSMLDWNDSVERLQNRVAQVGLWHPELQLPDVGTPHLMATAGEWLPFYLNQGGKMITSAAEMKKLNLHDIVWAILPYDMQMTIDRLAPTHIMLPSGRRAKIDYRPAASAPVVSVRLQECFGMAQTPTVDDGRVRLLMELLSPGFKPVQLTQDLGHFWQDTYFEVRKELKRRYPKHKWPDDPMNL